MSLSHPESPAMTTATSTRCVPLTTLASGQRATVEHRELACEDCELLTAMGLQDRCELRVCRGGSPCIVQVNQTRLGLSAPIAKKVLVRVAEDDVPRRIND